MFHFFSTHKRLQLGHFLWLFAVVLMASCSSEPAAEKAQRPDDCPELQQWDETIQNKISASVRSGHFTEKFQVDVCDCYDHEVRYTLDGSAPSMQSKVFTAPIWIDQNSAVKTQIEHIPTTVLEKKGPMHNLTWKEPGDSVPKAAILKLRSFVKGIPSGPEQTYYYFFQEHSTPIITVEVDSFHLFSDAQGILVPGDSYKKNGWGNEWWPSGNYRSGKAKKANVSYFDAARNLAFNAAVDFQVHGQIVGCFPNKCYRFTAKKKYGMGQFTTPIFEDQQVPWLKKFIIRNGGNDFSKSFIRDVLVHKIAAGMNVETQASRPVTMYLNGVYWGLYNQREKYDRHYFESHFGVKEKHLDLISTCGTEVIAGSNKDYRDLIDFVKQNDPNAPGFLEHIESQIDVDSYLDYLLLELFFANMDWPGNNVKIWRSNQEGGKWRWVIVDFDFSMGLEDQSYEYDMFQFVDGKLIDDWRTTECATILMRQLLRNKAFAQRFKDRYQTLKSSSLSAEQMTQQLDQLKAQYSKEMPLNIARWGYPSSMQEWNASMNFIATYLQRRHEFFEQHMHAFFEQAMPEGEKNTP